MQRYNIIDAALLETWNPGKKRKFGRNRELVLDVLARSERPLGAYELLRLLRDEGLRSPLQVYRVLDQLVEDGVVHKIESLSAFVLCTRNKRGRYAAFAICENCGQVSEIQDTGLEQALRALSKRESFHAKATTVEFSGLCEACSDG